MIDSRSLAEAVGRARAGVLRTLVCRIAAIGLFIASLGAGETPPPTPIVELVGPGLAKRWKAWVAAEDVLRRQATVEGYRLYGTHGSWDAEVSKALQIMLSRNYNPTMPRAVMEAALKAGCSDPLVRYCNLMTRQNTWASQGFMDAAAGAKPLPAEKLAPTATEFLAVTEDLLRAGYVPTLAAKAVNAGIGMLTMSEFDDAQLMQRLDACYMAVCQAVATYASDDPDRIRFALYSNRLVITYARVGRYEPNPILRYRQLSSMFALHRRLTDVAEAGLRNADPWWRAAVVGGNLIECTQWARDLHQLDTNMQAETGQLSEVQSLPRRKLSWSAEYDALIAAARPHLELAYQCHSDRVFPISLLIQTCGTGDAATRRQWFERAVRADPLETSVAFSYLAAIEAEPKPVDAVLGFALEVSEVYDKPWDSIPFTAVIRLRNYVPDLSSIWRDPRVWQIADRCTANDAKRETDRLAWAWRCEQRAEAIRLWRTNPRRHFSPATLVNLMASEEAILSDCAAWSRAAAPATDPQKPADQAPVPPAQAPF